MAAWLASDHLEFRGDDAVARGWLERAHRLLDDVVPESEDHGWLALHEGSYAMNVSGDLDRAAALAQRGAALGRALGPPDLEAVGLALEGFTHVRRGRVEAGMRLLDEASAIARGEDLRLPIAEGWALCYLISACEGVGDFPRAAQWCQAVRSVAERLGRPPARGDLPQRLRQRAGDERRLGGGRARADRGGRRPSALAARDGRRRARAARRAAGAPGPARRGARRCSRRPAPTCARSSGSACSRSRPATPPARPTAPSARCAARRPRRCSTGCPRSSCSCAPARRWASSTPPPRRTPSSSTPRPSSARRTCAGRARLAAGRLAAARGDHESARRAFEDAVDLLVEAAAAYEAALARLELAGALAALGRDQPAAAEEEAGRAALAALGAREPARVATAERRALNELTPRELEILRLVAQGLNDAEIAERLVLSQHTVHRHVANVRTKLRLPSRTAAVAYAARAGLL